MKPTSMSFKPDQHDQVLFNLNSLFFSIAVTVFQKSTN